MTHMQSIQTHSIRTRSVRAALILAFAIAAVTGCGKKTAPVNPASTAPPEAGGGSLSPWGQCLQD